MSLQSRARRIEKHLPGVSYEQIVKDLSRLRLQPKHDELYVEARRSRYYSELTCENCGGQYPAGLDKKGELESGVDSGNCPACFEESGTTFCTRCMRPLPGSDEYYCDECEVYVDGQ